jgi:sialate O-acetylesterase
VPNNGAGVELYIRLASYPNTFMVPICDLGSGTHYWNKTGYGARAARVALGVVYGEKIATNGPVYASHKIEGDKVIVSFTQIGKGLAFRNGDKLQGFALAGDDLKFVWADAKIEGEKVVLSSPQTSHPVFVRYAWADSHPWANFFNLDGLPAQLFRTDTAK